jgi:polyisoprenoid-binding protein YceI
MIPRAVQHLGGKPRRGVRWSLAALALTCLVVIACSERFGPQQAPPGLQPRSPVDVKGAQLIFVPAAASSVELQGTTNISSWKSRSADIHGKIALDIDATALNALFDQIQSSVPDGETRIEPHLPAQSAFAPPIAVITVPIVSFHGDNSVMDHDMQNALKAGQYPVIEYVFQELRQATVQREPGNPLAGLKLRVAGKLNVAGVGRIVTMDVIIRRDSRGQFRARAQTAMLMSDYGVTPPVALAGLIKAGDQVLVIFDLDLVLMHDPVSNAK